MKNTIGKALFALTVFGAVNFGAHAVDAAPSTKLTLLTPLDVQEECLHEGCDFEEMDELGIDVENLLESRVRPRLPIKGGGYRVVPIKGGGYIAP